MASTNKTSHYELSQFVSSDIPAWLVDYNGDMGKIDTGIAQAKTTADTAGQTADTAIANAQNAQETANTAVTNAAAAQVTATGADTKIGDLAELETATKSNVVNAINEINENLIDVEGAINGIVVDTLVGGETSKAPSVNSVVQKYNGVELYANTNGALATSITLSESVANFKHIEIVYGSSRIKTSKILSISDLIGNDLPLEHYISNASSTDYNFSGFFGAFYKANGTTLQYLKSQNFYMYNHESKPGLDGNAHVAIYKVIGYKN